jgi:hypothetical protein
MMTTNYDENIQDLHFHWIFYVLILFFYFPKNNLYLHYDLQFISLVFLLIMNVIESSVFSLF